MIRFIDGPHGGLHITAGDVEFVQQWARYVFPDCGCEYYGFMVMNRMTFWYNGKITRDEPIPEPFIKAFSAHTS